MGLKLYRHKAVDGSNRTMLTAECGPYYGMSWRFYKDMLDRRWLCGTIWYARRDSIHKGKFVLGYKYVSLPLVPLITVPIFVLGTAACVLS